MQCVYIHKRKSDNKIFYVGKGSEQRPFSMQGRKKNNLRWFKTFEKHGMTIHIIAKNLSCEAASILEIALIREIKKDKNNSLTNLTKGGEGTLGRVCSEGIKERMREMMTGSKNPNFGKTPTKESKRRQRETRLRNNIKHTKEAREKISKSRKGKKLSDETKKKLSDINRGKKHSAEAVEKIRISSTGRKHSEETRKKISEYKSGEGNNSKGKYLGESLRAVKVDQYDMDMVLIKTFNCIKEAGDLLGISRRNICTVCRGKRISCGGYKWRYNGK